MDPPVRLQAVVKGRVQGVGYRRWAAHEARLLGLAGWVRNTPDGAVEITAEGPRPALDAYLAALRMGPRYAAIDDVQFSLAPATGEYSDFGIR